MRKERDKLGPDAAIARIAANQHGVVSLPQLVLTGISQAGVTRRLAAGRLHRVHRAVYAVGHPHLSNEGRWMAAVLACGPGAVLSHESAAELWGIRGRPGDGASTVHVTVSSGAGKRRRNGIALHRSATLTDAACTKRDGIPVTGPTRTLADLKARLSPAQFAAALREAEFLRLPVGDLIGSRDPSLDPIAQGRRARSELEQRMLAICRRHRLPQPAVNASVDRYEVDFLWPEARLIVEVDGWEAHGTRSAFEQDRGRDARLTLLGYRVVRFTWRQLDRDPRGVAGTVRGLVKGWSAT
jgi:very-short-patch-repair endonuclease